MKQYEGANIPRGYIQTPSGPITSRKLHKTQRVNGQDLWTWRCDPDQRPLIWESVLEASAWIDKVWANDPKERAKCGWKIVQS